MNTADKMRIYLIYLEAAIRAFNNDPASSRYQEGYLAALKESLKVLKDFQKEDQPQTVKIKKQKMVRS